MKSTAKAPWLFYGLVAYVVLQFVWWEVLLAKQTRQLAEEQKKISALHFADKNLLEENIWQIETKKNHQLWMHVGEGTVFLILVSLGVLKIYNTRKKENELARLQNNFLLSVTHELKSPLASVKLQLQTLQKHSLDENVKNKLLQKALADNERLLRMIDNVLLASKAENENNILNLKKVNLQEALVKLVDQAFEENKNRIKINPVEAVFVDADEQFLSIIFSNLIENSLKYSPANSVVEINIHSQNNSPVVLVKDEGAGISDAEKENVFKKFYRIGNEETRSAKGTGLGLFITQNLCNLHGIQISISDNKPKGTIFALKFPQSKI
ncbi:MAG TPA: HAMP domain-containing sensor histidine kinase [Bacteroidia bacterium]|nr:HAMP domain-containing sensor histidine kinase [Bacteroidia bacterium]